MQGNADTTVGSVRAFRSVIEKETLTHCKLDHDINKQLVINNSIHEQRQSAQEHLSQLSQQLSEVRARAEQVNEAQQLQETLKDLRGAYATAAQCLAAEDELVNLREAIAELHTTLEAVRTLGYDNVLRKFSAKFRSL